MPTLKVSFTDTKNPTQDSIIVSLTNITGDPNPPPGKKNSPNPLTLKSGDPAGYWSYSGGFNFTISDPTKGAFPDVNNLDGSKTQPTTPTGGDKEWTDMYTVYINDPKNPPTSMGVDIDSAEDPPADNGVKVTRP